MRPRDVGSLERHVECKEAIEQGGFPIEVALSQSNAGNFFRLIFQ